MCLIYPKLIRKAPCQMHETKFIILNFLQSLIHHFHCYIMSFLPLYLSFHLHSLHRYHDSPHFLYFHPDSHHCHANSLYSIPILHSTLILRIFLIPIFKYLLSLYSSRIYFRKIVALVQKPTLPFLTIA